MVIALARIRRAAVGLKGKNQKVTIAALRNEIGCDSRELSSYLERIQGLKDEVELVEIAPALVPEAAGSQPNSFHTELKDAAKLLIERGELVTLSSLVKKIGCRMARLTMHLSRHEAARKDIGILSAFEVRCLRRRDRYRAAILELHQQGKQINRTTISQQCSIDRCIVSRDFSRTSDFDEFVREAIAAAARDLANSTPPP